MPAFECRRLLIVQDDRAAGALAAMCRPSRAEFLQTIQEGGIQLAASCHLQGACQRLQVGLSIADQYPPAKKKTIFHHIFSRTGSRCT